MQDSLALDTNVPVLIFKTHAYPIHHGAVGIARNLGRVGVAVHAIVEGPWTPLALSRYVAGSAAWRRICPDNGRLLDMLVAYGEELHRPTILVPTDDIGAAFIAEHADDLEQWFLFPRVPRKLPRELSNKASLYQLCARAGTPCPKYAVPRSIEDFHELVGKATFPLVVKSLSLLNGLASTQIARCFEDLVAIGDMIEARPDPGILCQEFVPGEDWILHAYNNMETGCFVAFTGRKLRSYPPFAGFTSAGIPVENQRLAAEAKSFVRAIGYSGLMDVDFRLDARDGVYKLVDFNPRVGANFRLFEDRSGLNVVRALHLDLTGRAVARSAQVKGRVFVVEPYDLVASVSYLRAGHLTLVELLVSMVGSKELAWFSWEDPLPFLAMCVWLLAKGLRRFAKRLRAFRAWDPRKILERSGPMLAAGKHESRKGRG